MVGRNPLASVELLSLLLIGAAGAAAAGYYTGTLRVLTTRPMFDRADQPASELWFTPAGHLAAAWKTGESVKVLITAPDGQVSGVREAPIPKEPYSLSPDGAWIFWRDARKLHWRSLSTEAPSELAAPVPRPVRDHVLLADGSAAMLLTTGAVEIRSPGALSAPAHEPEIERSTRIAAAGPYLALSSTTEWAVYRLLSHDEWRLIERGVAPAKIESLAVSPSGRVVTSTAGGWQLAGADLLTPGQVTSLAFGFEAAPFVAGEFDGIVQLRPGTVPLEVMRPHAPAIALAANDNYVAYSTGAGLRAASFFVETRVTPVGYTFGVLAVGMFSLIFVLPVVGWIMGRFEWRRQIQSVRRGDAGLGQDFPVPLTQAILSHQCVLYGGDHLGALAGYPTWLEFAPYAIEWASNEQLIAPEAAASLREKAQKNPQAAIDELVNEAIAFREKLAAFYREVYLSELHPSAAHEALYAMPFVGVISSGVDPGLDPLAARREAEHHSPDQPGYVKLVRNGQFFSLRLRGELSDPEAASLSRAEVKKRLAASEEFTEAIRFLAQTRTFLFVGVTLDDIEAEIGHLQFPASNRQHFAYVPTRDLGSRERRISVRLAEEYGIQVFPYPADRGADVLSPLLEAVSSQFSEKIKRWKPGEKPA